ncbi:unnamed protein product [Cutaneotrichosporon oleaginosum]
MPLEASHPLPHSGLTPSPPQSDYFGVPSLSGSTAITSTSHEVVSPLQKPAVFHSLHGIQEAAESIGLAPPPGTTFPPPVHDVSTPGSFHTASSSERDSSIYTDPVQYNYAEEHYTGTYNYGEKKVYDYGEDKVYDYGEDKMYDYAEAKLHGSDFGNAFGVDPLYADDGPCEAELCRAPSIRSRAESYIGLGISNGRPPSAMSGRASPSRFPSNPDRPGSPMRLPPSPTPACGQPPSYSSAGSQRLPPSPGPQRLPSPRSIGEHQSSQANSPSSVPSSGSSLRLPPSPSPVLPHSPRAPSPLAMSWEAPQLEPEPTPRALPQPPETPPSSRIRRVPVPSAQNSGATRRMVAAWENSAPAVGTPTLSRPLPIPTSAPASSSSPPSYHTRSQPSQGNSPSQRHMSQRYLAEKETKPLPIPTAKPIPASAAMPWPPPDSARPVRSAEFQSSPQATRTSPNCSPIKGLSPGWSLFNKQEHHGEVDSPKSPGKEKISLRHPLKDIKNAFSNLRKMGHKEKDEPTGWGTASVGMHGDRPHQRIDEDWFRSPMDPPVLDRMGDAEMAVEEEEVRTGGVLWLTAPQGTRYGDWMTAWACLSPTHFSVAHVPVISGGPYNAYRPVPLRRDEEHLMRTCSSFRYMSPSELAHLFLPSLPEPGDVIELEFAHGATRYLAVESGTSAAWISALSDVRSSFGAFAPSVKSYHDGSLRLGQVEDIAKFGDTWVGTADAGGWQMIGGSPRTIPYQPSPMRSQHTGLSAAALEDMAEEADKPPTPPPKSRPRSTLIADRVATFSPEIKPTPPLKLHRKKESDNTLLTQGHRSSQSHDTTGAVVDVSSQPTGSSYPNSPQLKERETPRGARPGTTTPLRAASLQQIDPMTTSIADRIRSWQPEKGVAPPRTASRAASVKSGLSFNSSDLNPSRSASQVRPARNAGVDLAAVDAGLNKLPVLKEAGWGPRSPARKAVPKYEEATPRSARSVASAKLPDMPAPASEPEAPAEHARRADTSVQPEPAKSADIPSSPRPRRLNTRIAAAKEKFEGSPQPNTLSPVMKAAAIPRSPLTKTATPRSTTKPASATTPIHAPVARPTTSAALLETAARTDVSGKSTDTLALPALALAPKAPGSAASAGSTSVRDRIEALSRAAASPVSTTKRPISTSKAIPEDRVAGTRLARWESPTIEFPSLVVRSLASPPRSHALRSLGSPQITVVSLPSLASPPPSTAPLALRKVSPSMVSTTSRRTLMIANPDPDPDPESHEQQIPADVARGSEVSDATETRESITGLLAGYDEPANAGSDSASWVNVGRDDDGEAEDAARAAPAPEPAETAAPRAFMSADMPDAARDTSADPSVRATLDVMTDQLRALNTDLGAVSSLLTETAGHQATTTAGAEERLIALDRHMATIRSQLDEVLAGVAANTATLGAVALGREGQVDGAQPLAAEQRAVPPGEASEAAPDDPIARSATAPVAGAETAPVAACADAPAVDRSADPTAPTEPGEPTIDLADTPADADQALAPAARALDPITGEPLSSKLELELDNIRRNIEYVANDIVSLQAALRKTLADAVEAGSNLVLDKLETYEGTRAALESRKMYEAGEKVVAAEKAAEEARAELEKVKAEAVEKAQAAVAAEDVKPVEVPDVPKVEDAPALADEAKPQDAPKEIAPPEAEDKEVPAPPPPAATAEQVVALTAQIDKSATAEQVDALTAQVAKYAEAQAQAQENQSKISAYLGELNGYLVTVIKRQDELAVETAARYEQSAARLDELKAETAQEIAGLKNVVLDALHGLGTDLTQSIKGERLNFIDAMEKATTLKLENHTRDFAEAIRSDVKTAQVSMLELHEQRSRIRADMTEMLNFILKHADKSEVSFPKYMQEQLDKHAETLEQINAASPPPGARPLPQTPAAPQ